MSEFTDYVEVSGDLTRKTVGSNISDSFTARGIVKKELIDNETGKVIKTLEDHNLIVKVGRTALINMLAGNKTDSISKMAIGKGGTADLTTNAFNPVAPTDGDTALLDKIIAVNITSKSVSTEGTNPKVTFVALFDCTDVDSLVNECGLYFTDGSTIFARHTFDTVSLKANSGFSLQVSWTVEF